MRDFLDKASKFYYEGNSIISDATFDLLAAKYNYKTVGYEVTDAVPHAYQMYSLQKCFDLSKAPLDIADCIETPKLDGAAVSILYVNGLLQIALTRGDGIHGRDITDKIRLLVPNKISAKQLIQITGEVVAPSSIPNARNYAAGALSLKELSEFKSRDVQFVAYDASPSLASKYACSLEVLHQMGLNVVTRFNADDYPTDGLVFRVKSNDTFEELGYTAHHPRGAFALKEQAEGIATTLLDVVWQVGKSGVVSPVAILEPVVIGEAVVGRATLHNIQYIRDLNLEIGCPVEVIRSGEIIPRVVRRINVDLPEEK